MPKIMVDYDHPPGPDEPTEMDLSYAEMDPDMVAAMARSGDKGAVDFVNAQWEAQQEAEANPGQVKPSVSRPTTA